MGLFDYFPAWFDLIFFFFFLFGSTFGFRICYWFDLILGWIFLWVHGGRVGGCRGGGGRRWGIAMMMVVAWPWVSGLRFLGLPWGGGVVMGFSLGMFFVVVVVAGRGDLGFCFYLSFGIYYFIM